MKCRNCGHELRQGVRGLWRHTKPTSNSMGNLGYKLSIDCKTKVSSDWLDYCKCTNPQPEAKQ